MERDEPAIHTSAINSAGTRVFASLTVYVRVPDAKKVVINIMALIVSRRHL